MNNISTYAMVSWFIIWWSMEWWNDPPALKKIPWPRGKTDDLCLASKNISEGQLNLHHHQFMDVPSLSSEETTQCITNNYIINIYIYIIFILYNVCSSSSIALTAWWAMFFFFPWNRWTVGISGPVVESLFCRSPICIAPGAGKSSLHVGKMSNTGVNMLTLKRPLWKVN